MRRKQVAICCRMCKTLFFVRASYTKRRSYCSPECRKKQTRLKKESNHLLRKEKDLRLGRTVTIYGITNERNHVIYVGVCITNRENQRLLEHSNRGPCHALKDIRMSKLETVLPHQWREREKWWIQHYLSRGDSLLNRRDGGGGDLPPYRRIEKTCQRCGTNFTITPSRDREGRGKFCSKKCIKSQFPTRPCEICQKPIILTFKTRKRRFCSYQCSGENTRKLLHSGKKSIPPTDHFGRFRTWKHL